MEIRNQVFGVSKAFFVPQETPEAMACSDWEKTWFLYKCRVSVAGRGSPACLTQSHLTGNIARRGSPACLTQSKRSGPSKPSIPSSAEQRGARIEGCGKRGKSSQTRTLRYSLHFALRLRSGRGSGLLRMLHGYPLNGYDQTTYCRGREPGLLDPITLDRQEDGKEQRWLIDVPSPGRNPPGLPGPSRRSILGEEGPWLLVYPQGRVHS